MSKTVSGELITIDDSAYDGFKGMTIYGNTRQNLWVNPSRTQRGVTVTSNADGSFSVSGTADAAATNSVVVNVSSYVLKPSTQYTFSCDKPIAFDTKYGFIVDEVASDDSVIVGHYLSLDGATTKVTFTTGKNMAYARFGVSVAASATASGTYRVMLNEGSEAQPWCPPGLNSVGDDGSVKIVTAGKNLFNAVSGDKINVGPDGAITLVAGFSWADFSRQRIHIPKGTKITLSKSVTLGANCGPGVWLVDRSGHQEEFLAYGSTNKNTYETTRDCDYITCFVNSGTVTADTPFYVQLELGSTATAYEPPNINATPIDLQGHTLNSLPDGTRDELHIDGGGNVVLEKRCGDRVVDGTSLAVKSLENSDKKEARINVGDSYYGSSAGDDTSNQILSDKLPSYDPDILWSDKPRNGCASSVSRQIAARCNDMSSISAFNQFFQQNNMHVIYKLVEPQTIDLGKINLPKLRKKPLVNNVFANGSAETTNFYLDTEMELTYRQWPGVRADGFKVSGKHNFWDFASCVASSDSGKPEKKFVTATVPYMSGFYDLSKIYGAIAYESRDVSYTFELLGDDMEDLQRQKTNLLDWLGLVHDEPIYDDTQPNYHYVGSFYEADWEEDETGESGTLTVTFKCQPFLIADRATEESLSVGTHTVVNNGQQVSVFAKANSGSATVKINGVIQAVTTTEQRLTAQLQPGENEVVVTSNSVTLRYYERHL